MAGIGFELRRLLRSGSFTGVLRGYAYAGLISSGPWVLSILGVMLIGILSAQLSPRGVSQFLVCVTYLMAGSLILTGPLQLLFTRFASDRLYEKRDAVVIPNLLGALAVTSGVSGTLGALVVGFGFDEPLLFRLILVSTFVVLCDIWVGLVLLSGLKEYRSILGVFFLGYGLSVCGALGLRPFGREGLMVGFLMGQAWLLAGLLALVVRRYPLERLVAFDFLDRKQVFPSLALTGLLYNLGVWADKFIFWFAPDTSQPVVGVFRSSIVYDLPMFLAYLSIIPGMAVYLVRVETDFAEQHAAFYDAVRARATLDEIERVKDKLVATIRRAFTELAKIQGFCVLVLLVFGKELLTSVGLSPLHFPLYAIDVVAAALQVALLALLNVFFYFDQRRVALGVTALLCVANVALTFASRALGPTFYGYGYGGAMLLTVVVGIAVLARKLDRLELETFMLQR